MVKANVLLNWNFQARLFFSDSFPRIHPHKMSLEYKDALGRLENRRVKSTRPLIPPQILQEDLPMFVAIARIGIQA